MQQHSIQYVTYRAVAEKIVACTIEEELDAEAAWIARDIAAYPHEYDEKHIQLLRGLVTSQRHLILKGSLPYERSL